MVRNLSFKTDDDFDDRLYSVSKKKGMTKSAFIKSELSKVMDAEEGEKTSDKNFSNSFTGSGNYVDIHNEEKKTKFERKVEDSGGQMDELNREEVKTPSELIPNITHVQPAIDKEEVIAQEKKELKELSDLKDLKIEINNHEDDVNRLDDLVKNKTLVQEKEEPRTEENKQTKAVHPRLKYVIKPKVKRVNDEEQYNQTPVNIDEKVERISRKLREQEKFQETIKDMHGKVNSACEDGKCLRNEMDVLKSKLGKIDDICEDGKCIRTEIGDIKKELNEFKEFKKSLDELKGGVIDIKSGFTNLDKKTVKKEICPQCSWGVEEGSSNCPNCGLEIKEWYDEKGNKLDWKPFKERHKNN